MNWNQILLIVIASLLLGIEYELKEIKRHIFDNLFDIRYLIAGEDPHRFGSKHTYARFQKEE